MLLLNCFKANSSETTVYDQLAPQYGGITLQNWGGLVCLEYLGENAVS